MKKRGKYEKVPQTKNCAATEKSLMQTYITSLISLMLCVTMFFGTTVAWFTSEVESPVNEIYIGVLDVKLAYKAVENNLVPDSWTEIGNDPANPAPAIFTNDIHWEPGYTAIRTFKLTNNGDLAFKYKMDATIDLTAATAGDGDQLTLEEMQELARQFTVFVLTADEEIKPSKETGLEGWTELGSLADVLFNGVALTSGEMDEEAVQSKESSDYFAVAIKMNESAESEHMGKKLSNISIKLIAYQRTAEEDAFGSEYDKDAAGFTYLLPNFEKKTVVPADVKDGNLNVGELLTEGQDEVHFILDGQFDGVVNVVVPEGKTMIIDGSKATGITQVKVGYSGGVAHSYDDIKPDKNEKTGKYYIAGFKGSATVISAAVHNTSLVIANNEVAAIDVVSGNIDLEIIGNTINGAFGSYEDYEPGGNPNSYGVSLRICDYTLSITHNTITNVQSHAVGINGRQDESGAAWGVSSRITSFANNHITLNSTEKDERAALKIWNDVVYEPLNTTPPVDAVKVLMKDILENGNNTIVYDGKHKDTHVVFDIDSFISRDGENQVTAS